MNSFVILKAILLIKNRVKIRHTMSDFFVFAYQKSYKYKIKKKILLINHNNIQTQLF